MLSMLATHFQQYEESLRWDGGNDDDFYGRSVLSDVYFAFFS